MTASYRVVLDAREVERDATPRSDALEVRAVRLDATDPSGARARLHDDFLVDRQSTAGERAGHDGAGSAAEKTRSIQTRGRPVSSASGAPANTASSTARSSSSPRPLTLSTATTGQWASDG